MTMKDDQTTNTCNHCNLVDTKILHHIRHTGNFLRLCTTCVLLLHRKQFCPTCLTVYHLSPPQNAVACFKCQSYTHRTCIPPSLPVRTPCATCVNPNSIVFNPRSSDLSNNSKRMIDVVSARLLFAAAEISVVSMNKAEAAAVMEADWRAKDASDWRKKAKEAVDYVVEAREIEKKKGNDGNGSFVMDIVGGDSDSVEVFDALDKVNIEGGQMWSK